ncbi:MAG: hypothetical protein MI923_03235 [Phycisphaerales bacterium]|nr:hypothetical protein [Phycisphaerales bacterium]
MFNVKVAAFAGSPPTCVTVSSVSGSLSTSVSLPKRPVGTVLMTSVWPLVTW